MNRGKIVILGSIKGVSAGFTITILTGLLLIQGCTTVLSTNAQSAKQEISVERDALKMAVAEVAETNWPKPEKISFGRRLTGGAAPKDQRVSKADAVNAYVLSLSGNNEPAAALMSDAERHLRAARRLIGHAEAATNSIRPTMSDVAMLEGAIGDLRQCREIYISALKMLAAKDSGEQRAFSATLRAQFGIVISDIGAVADTLAEKAANDRTETFAGPGVRNKQNRY